MNGFIKEEQEEPVEESSAKGNMFGDPFFCSVNQEGKMILLDVKNDSNKE